MRFKLIEHNTPEQQNWASHDDTREYLTVGKVYEGEKEVHSWHTKILINGHNFNSVCFEEILKCKKKK
jgi:hypothetical protein